MVSIEGKCLAVCTRTYVPVFGNLSIFKVSIWQKKIFRTFKIRFKMKWTCDMPTALAISRNVYLQSLSNISLCLRLLHSLLHVQVGNIFFGLLQTEISFSLYEDTLLEPWISQFSKKVFFWMVLCKIKKSNFFNILNPFHNQQWSKTGYIDFFGICNSSQISCCIFNIKHPITICML